MTDKQTHRQTWLNAIPQTNSWVVITKWRENRIRKLVAHSYTNAYRACEDGFTDLSQRNVEYADCSGILVTVKQRQEFRIRLQKRARRVAERKLESFMEERNARAVRNSPVLRFRIDLQQWKIVVQYTDTARVNFAFIMAFCAWWFGSRVVKTSDLRLEGRGFASRSRHCLVIYFWDRWPSLAGKLSWEL